MKHFFTLSLILLVFTFFACGQKKTNTLERDSLFHSILNDFPENKKNELLKIYNEGDEESKDIFLALLSMPRSSKKKLIANIDSNLEKINLLKTSYLKLVPKGYIVSIEFNPADPITKESIDLKIENLIDKKISLKQEWRLEYDSKVLAEMIKPLGWTNTTLNKIKDLLFDANCISIENGEMTTIGFARSGLGKYYFKLFDKDLSTEQAKQYNDGCNFIVYKKNIVLGYGGGAAGPQCFPD